MKIAANQIEAYVKKLPTHLRGVLLYGPDHGLVQERAGVLLSQLVPNPHDPFAVTDLSGEQIKDDPALLMDEVAAMSFFGGRKVIRIRDAAEKAADALAQLFAHPPSGKPEDLGFVLVLADELTPKSGLRACFEGGSEIAALPCYHDEAVGVMNLIREECRKRGLNAQSDAIHYLSEQLQGDRMLIRQEMEKLDLYLGQEREVTLNAAKACVGDQQEATLDDLAENVGLMEQAECDRLARKCWGQGLLPIPVLRALSRHFQKLETAALAMQRGLSADQALQQLRPPLFFKQQTSFRKQLMTWQQPQRIRRAIQLLYQAELKIKTEGHNPETLAERAISILSRRST